MTLAQELAACAYTYAVASTDAQGKAAAYLAYQVCLDLGEWDAAMMWLARSK